MSDPANADLRFAYRLALARGWSFDRTLDDTGSAEWNGWLAMAALEPFGPLRDDHRAGVVAASFHTAWGGRAVAGDFFETLRDKAAKADRLRAATIARCPAFGGG